MALPACLFSQASSGRGFLRDCLQVLKSRFACRISPMFLFHRLLKVSLFGQENSHGLPQEPPQGLSGDVSFCLETGGKWRGTFVLRGWTGISRCSSVPGLLAASGRTMDEDLHLHTRVERGSNMLSGIQCLLVSSSVKLKSRSRVS